MIIEQTEQEHWAFHGMALGKAVFNKDLNKDGRGHIRAHSFNEADARKVFRSVSIKQGIIYPAHAYPIVAKACVAGVKVAGRELTQQRRNITNN